MPPEEIALAPISEAEWKSMSELMSELRKIRRDNLFVPVARLQLHYTLNRIEQINETDSDERVRALKFARGIAFNIAAFTWPGWDDTGPIAPEQQELGLSAARVTLDLATQANDVTVNAMWINGAHELNAKHFDAAIKFFEQARLKADSGSGEKMALGWVALTELLQANSPSRRAQLDQALEDLRQADQENGEFFAQQIETALDVYTR